MGRVGAAITPECAQLHKSYRHTTRLFINMSDFGMQFNEKKIVSPESWVWCGYLKGMRAEMEAKCALFLTMLKMTIFESLFATWNDQRHVCQSCQPDKWSFKRRRGSKWRSSRVSQSSHATGMPHLMVFSLIHNFSMRFWSKDHGLVKIISKNQYDKDLEQVKLFHFSFLSTRRT